MAKSKHVKDKSLKTQLLLTTNHEKASETEKIWRHSGFFGDQKGDFSISKVNLIENTLCNANKATVSTVKEDYVILGQLIPAKNNPESIDEYKCKQNEV